MKFKSQVAGQVAGVHFYKGSGNSGTHVGRLWSSSGQLSAKATSSNRTALGWQQVSFASPVVIPYRRDQSNPCTLSRASWSRCATWYSLTLEDARPTRA